MYKEIKAIINISEQIENIVEDINENIADVEVFVKTPIGSFQIFFDVKFTHRNNKPINLLENIRIYDIAGNLIDGDNISFEDEFWLREN